MISANLAGAKHIRTRPVLIGFIGGTRPHAIAPRLKRSSPKRGAAIPWDVSRALFGGIVFQLGVQNIHCLKLVSVGGKFVREDDVDGRVPPHQTKEASRREPNLRQVVCEMDIRTGVISAHLQSADVFRADVAQNGMSRGQLAIAGWIGSSQFTNVQDELTTYIVAARRKKTPFDRPGHTVKRWALARDDMLSYSTSLMEPNLHLSCPKRSIKLKTQTTAQSRVGSANSVPKTDSAPILAPKARLLKKSMNCARRVFNRLSLIVNDDTCSPTRLVVPS